MSDSMKIRKVTRSFTPTNSQVNQSKHLFTAYAGEIPMQAVARVLVGTAGMGVPLVKIGDATITDRLINAAQIDAVNTGLKCGVGSNDVAGKGAYVYTASTQINVGYNTNTVGPLADKCTVRFTVWLLDSDR